MLSAARLFTQRTLPMNGMLPMRTTYAHTNMPPPNENDPDRLRPPPPTYTESVDHYPESVIPPEFVSTMNDLPSPEGDWLSDYKRKQVRHNLRLLGGTVFLVSTFIWGQYKGYYKVYHDWAPAEELPIIEDYRVYLPR